MSWDSFGYQTSSGSGPWNGLAKEWTRAWEESSNYSSNTNLDDPQSSHAAHEAWGDGMGDFDGTTYYGGNHRLQPGQVMSPKIPPRFDGVMAPRSLV